MKDKVTVFLMILVLATVMVGCGIETNNENKSEGTANKEAKGDIRVAFPSQPPTLDPQITTSSPTRDVSRHIFETLVTLNSNYEPVPMLAERVEKSEDNKTYTFYLRDNVTFHNGKKMTAEDVVASMNRWLEKSSSVGVLLDGASFNMVDKYTVELALKEPTPLALSPLSASTQFPAIMPKEVIESAEAEGVQEYIGTGPFRLKEWKQDQYIHLTRYEDYEPANSDPDGLSGKKEALVENIYFELVGDPSTRMAGVSSGEYQVGLYMPHENYEQLKTDSDLSVDADIAGNLILVFNKNEGIFADKKMRQAVNAALDFEKVLSGAFFDEALYRLNSSYMLKEQVNWYSQAGEGFYNENDHAKAKSLIEESGYDGEEIVFLATRQYPFNYNASVIVQEQLKNIGLNVKLELYDWTTIVDLREDPANWELLITGYPIVSTPIESVFFNSEYYDGPVSAKTLNLLEEIKSATTEEEAKKFWDELQEHTWEEIPFIKFGEYTDISTNNDLIEGYTYFEGPILWNTALVK